MSGKPEPHKHTDACWEPDSGCDMGRNEAHAIAVHESSGDVFTDLELGSVEDWLAQRIRDLDDPSKWTELDEFIREWESCPIRAAVLAEARRRIRVRH